MGAEFIKALVKEEKVEYPSVPPGFDSLTSFTLKKIDVSEDTASEVDSKSQRILTTEGDIGDAAKLAESLRRKSWINFSEFASSPKKSEPEQFIENLIPRSLPKGVLRGCSECSNCQKVVAKWHPEEACRPVLRDAPVFHPTEEEFKDALKYIAAIRPRAEKYGICRIVPPPSWNPPCPQKEKNTWEKLKFPTRVQEIDKLQIRESTMKMSRIHESSKRKKRKYQETEVESTIGDGDVTKPNDHECNDEIKQFGFERGPVFTLEAFQKYADDFKSHYFGKDSNLEGDNGSFQKLWEPSVENIEGEYWRIIEKPTEEIEVLYGADLDSGVFGIGFPKVSYVNSDYEEKHLSSEWNLNLISRLPTSLLSFEKCNIPGVIVPCLYTGMCFSSFCWHVEDHYLYSLSYMHLGAPKVWYGVPGEDALKLEAAMKKHFPDLFKEQPDLFHKLVTQLSPSTLSSESVPVYRCVQNPKEFVLTFPRAYRSGFNCGFNCTEAVNVAPLDWLPYGQHAVELYREQSRKTTISHDKLLFGAAKEMVRAQWELQLLRKNTLVNLRWKEVCGRKGALANAFKRRVEMETTRRQYLCSSYSVEKMDTSFDAASERECVVCLYDLHLSAVGCRCSPERFACLYHAKELCTCALSEKTYLFRYAMEDLNVLVKALEGTLSAIYKWAKLDLGLALSPLVSKDNSQSPGPDVKPFNFLEGKKEEGRVPSAVTSASIGPMCRELKAPELVKESTSPNMATLSTEPHQGKSIKKESMGSSSLKEVPLNKSVGWETHANKSLASRNNNIILLSDDEDGGLVNRSLGKATGDYSKFLKLSGRLDDYNDKVGPCSYTKEQVLYSLQSNIMGESNVIMKPEVRKEDHSSYPAHLKLDHGKGHKLMNSSMLSSYYNVQPFTQNSSCDLKTGSIKNISSKGDYGFPELAKAGIFPHSYGIRETNNELKDEKTGLVSSLRSNTGSSSRAVKTLDKKFLKNGPWMGKSVRRMNCIVQPLEFGVVCSGKLWSTSQTIYPKGFKTRVSYLSVLDPEKCCYYVSEILDAGLSRPLFMVKVETCPNEVFIHLSATKCWDMVKDRLNEEIMKQVRLGRVNLPCFQPKGSVDGFEMFGFSSPEIIKGIEALDPNRVCTEYWKSRAQTDPSLRSNLMKVVDYYYQASKEPDKLLLEALFRKANTEELHSLHNLLSGDQASVDRVVATRLLDDEIHRRSNKYLGYESGNGFHYI